MKLNFANVFTNTGICGLHETHVDENISVSAALDHLLATPRNARLQAFDVDLPTLMKIPQDLERFEDGAHLTEHEGCAAEVEENRVIAC